MIPPLISRRELWIFLAIAVALTLITVALLRANPAVPEIPPAAVVPVPLGTPTTVVGMTGTQIFILSLVGLFVTPAAAIITPIVTARWTRRELAAAKDDVKRDVEDVHKDLNSRMDHAIKVIGEQKYTEGVQEERTRWETKLKEEEIAYAAGVAAERARLTGAVTPPATLPVTPPPPIGNQKP